MTKQEEKRRLRKSIRELESQLSARYRRESDAAITAHLLAMPSFQAAKAIFCFVGTAHEIDTRPILEHALSSGKILCVPLCVEPGRMELRQITALAQLAPGTCGILEPQENAPLVLPDEVDFSILPCLTCNHCGHRLGKGGGYYDRFLSQYRGGTVLLCREHLIREEIPLEPHDYPVPWVLTERGLYEDGSPARLG
ncbi:5-formyltetrahydrofolate cyclo-ligase [Oscillibacter sp.]|uniref:5-formyltetrahydrofolate cyclo-ligase n=1 Tax=Oscillibacter sp. TaxID=1945593 RepID=UPI00260CF64F|nr:5-formyltetrahydrofolate cyclo-ligase [Oscillibacter sp.]MDD3347846.1 5-formyltetrahydrofolate cyclo-ligase [Oscillibacter sp.]